MNVIKKLILFAVVVFAVLKFAGVTPRGVKHDINALSQDSARTMMGGVGSSN